ALRAQFEEKLEGLERAAALLADALRREDAAPAHARDGLEHFIRHHRFRALSRDMAADLIERIDVREGGKIDIQFRYRDELAALEEP
ncbi:MAG: hypothetical protein IKS52_07175, partial [Clostridia bacterium]|nr:hypothetical protein [Clostridia bacterium]